MKDSLTKRVRALESKLPTAEDLQEQATRAFLGTCTLEELRLLQCIAEAKEQGEEILSLTEEEERAVSAVLERWSAL